MTAPTIPPSRAPLSMSTRKALLLTLPMLLLTAFMSTGGSLPEDPRMLVSILVTWLGLNVLFFLMLRSGKTDRYRAIFFIGLALSMILTFASIIQQTRGSTQLTMDDIVNGRTPFCHLVIPMILLPAALTGSVIFPGSLLSGFASIASMVTLWLGATFIMGRGFCSWVCFYGGLDDGCSRIARKPLLRKIDPRWLYLPFAVLLVIVLWSALSMDVVYCAWLCPFKAVTEYEKVVSLETLIKTIIFVGVFIALVIVLPILTKKRTQCGLFCPFGAFQSFTNPVNVFDVRIDTETCSGCKRCINSCPTYSLDENSLVSGKTRITCTKCGKCADVCTRNAINYHIKGTPVGSRPALARALFLYPVYLFGAIFATGTVSTAIYSLIMLATTGRLF